jgi:hypothetical protein
MKPLTFALILLLLACSSGTQISPHSGKMIVPGKGTDEVQVGMLKSEIVDLLGQPETVDAGGRTLDYRENYGLDFLLADGDHVVEIRFSQSFRGRLPSRIKVGSRMTDVFKAYGTPTERLEVPSQAIDSKDRVLYITPDAQEITYKRLGLSFYFSPQKNVSQIVVFKPLPDRNIRVEPQKEGSR